MTKNDLIVELVDALHNASNLASYVSTMVSKEEKPGYPSPYSVVKQHEADIMKALEIARNFWEPSE